jgi:uncharacterized protein YegL
MIRHQPPSDWVVYVVVIGVSLATLLGKHLVMKGDEPIEQAIKEDIETIENEIEEIEEKIEDKIS